MRFNSKFQKKKKNETIENEYGFGIQRGCLVWRVCLGVSRTHKVELGNSKEL